MTVLAALVAALALAQGEPEPSAAPAERDRPAAPAADDVAPPAPAAPLPSRPPPAASGHEEEEAQPTPPRRAPRPANANANTNANANANANATPNATPNAKATSTSTSTRPLPSPSDPERTQVAKAALAFLDALVAGDADGLAALSSERFSFDGDVRSGRDAIRAGWRSVLTGRAAKGALLDLEVVPAADAVARLGPPPARVAPLAGRGGWIGIADVSGRAVIVFLVREGGRWVVAGLHD